MTHISTSNFTVSNTLMPWLKQLGIAALYASLSYADSIFFDNNKAAWHFEPSSGLALAALLIGGRRYAWGVLLGAVLIHLVAGGPLFETVIIASGDTLQAICGAWLINRSGKFDLRLQTMKAYLRLMLLGGCASIILGALAVNISLLGAGLLTTGKFVQNLHSWWMGDMLGVVLVAPLVMVWWRAKIDWHNTEQNLEAVLLLGLTIFVGQIVFFDWLHDSIGQVAKAYWMFIFIAFVATRLGTRGVTIALTVVAVQAMLSALLGTGFFAKDIAESHLSNYWFFAVILSVVGMTLATHLAERERMESQLRNLSAHLQTVREKEMIRIAREIHDDLGSTLTALKMEIYMLKDGLSMITDPEPHLGHMESISQLIKTAAGIAQRIITGLRPAILDDLGLLAALEWQAGQFQKFSGIECRVNCVGDKGDLDQPRSIALFRISQEALTNVARHSGASRVEIEYHHSEGEIVLSIIDNGRGMAEKRADTSISYGILGMQERAYQLGGTVNFETPPGGGFSVTVILPLTDHLEDET